MEVEGTFEGRYLLVTRTGTGSRTSAGARGDVTYTNPATGASVTEVTRSWRRTCGSAYDDEGLATILVMSTGNAVLYDDSTGKAVGAQPRSDARARSSSTTGGTPDDPEDDTVTFLGLVKGSTGRTDDFCEAVLPVLFP